MIELAYEIANEAFKTRLEDAVEFALAEIKRVGRDLGHNVPYKETNPYMYIHMAWKFNVRKHAIINSKDERVMMR